MPFKARLDLIEASLCRTIADPESGLTPAFYFAKTYKRQDVFKMIEEKEILDQEENERTDGDSGV